MELSALKLELIRRVLLCTDEAVLREVERLLDTPTGYVIDSGSSIVQEPEEPMRTYTHDEVKRMLEEDRVRQAARRHDPSDVELTADELAVLDARRERHLNGDSRSHTWEQVEAMLKSDIQR